MRACVTYSLTVRVEMSVYLLTYLLTIRLLQFVYCVLDLRSSATVDIFFSVRDQAGQLQTHKMLALFCLKVTNSEVL